MEKETVDGKTSVVTQWLVAILANCIFLTLGLQTGWTSAMTQTLQSDRSPTGRPLTDTELSYLGNVPSLAAIVSVSIFSYLVNVIGRRNCIIIFAIFQALCWIIKLCPATTISLIVARVCMGITGGGCFSIVPMYVKEISQNHIRGTLGLLLVLMQYVGILAMYAMGGYLNYNTVLYIVVGIPIINGILMLKAPESPTYLVKIGKIEEATAAIAFLRGVDKDEKLVHVEIDEIKSEDEKFRSIPNVSFVGIFKQPVWRKGFLLMVFVMTAHGMNGAFAILTYAYTILRSSGVTAVSPEIMSLTIPAVMIASSFLSMALIDRLGRKIILGGCFAVSVLSFSGLAAILILQQQGVAVPVWLPVSAILISVSHFASGVGSCPFIIMSEMFNFQIRAKVMGVFVTIGWLFSFIQLACYTSLTTMVGVYMPFICFAAFNLLGVFVVLLLPETSGKSVEEIEMELSRRQTKKQSGD